VPIHLMPHMYQLRTMRPVVQGTVKNSPAARAGIEYGDLILAVDDERVFTRSQTSALLHPAMGTRASRLRAFAWNATAPLDIVVPHLRDPQEAGVPIPTTHERFGAQYLAGGRWASSCRTASSSLASCNSWESSRSTPESASLLFISELGEPPFHRGNGDAGPAGSIVDRADLYVQKLWPRYWGGNVLSGTSGPRRHHRADAGVDRGERHPPGCHRGAGDLPGARGPRPAESCYLEVERALDIEAVPATLQPHRHLSGGGRRAGQ